MASSAQKKGRKPPSNANSRNRVGEFFEHLALLILSGELNKDHDYKYGDLINWDLGLGVEVKSGDNNRYLKIPVEQKRMYEEIAFPLSSFAYLLCCYQGYKKARSKYGRLRKRTGKKFSLLGRFVKRTDQHQALAQNIGDIFLFDIGIINAIEKELGTFPGSQPSREEGRELRLWREHMYRFRNGDFESTLLHLGLNPKEWVLCRYEIKKSLSIPDPDYFGTKIENSFHKYNVEFNLYTVLPKRFSRRFRSNLGRDLRMDTRKPV